MDIGVGLDDTSFTIPGLDKRNEKHPVPRQDGINWDTSDPNKAYSGPFGKEWMSELQARRALLEANPDYQFVTLVAGFANSSVEQLYDVGDIQALLRMERSREAQERASLARAGQVSLEKRQQELVSLENRIEAMERHGVLLASVELSWINSYRDGITLANPVRLGKAFSLLLADIRETIMDPFWGIVQSLAIDLALGGAAAKVDTYWGKVNGLDEKARKIHERLVDIKNNAPSGFVRGIRPIRRTRHEVPTTTPPEPGREQSPLEEIIDEILDAVFFWLSEKEDKGQTFSDWKGRGSDIGPKLQYLAEKAKRRVTYTNLKSEVDVALSSIEGPFATAVLDALNRLSTDPGAYFSRAQLQLLWQGATPTFLNVDPFNPSERKAVVNEFLPRLEESIIVVQTQTYIAAKGTFLVRAPERHNQIINETRHLPGQPIFIALATAGEVTRLASLDNTAKLKVAIQRRVSLRKTIDAMLEGRSVIRPPQADYQHGLSWVLRPANSATVSLKDTVRAAMNNAYRVFKDKAWRKSAGRGKDLWGQREDRPPTSTLPSPEDLQRSSLAKNDFAKLVATDMGLAALLAPRQYYQRDFKRHVMIERENALLYLRDGLVYGVNSITEK